MTLSDLSVVGFLAEAELRTPDGKRRGGMYGPGEGITTDPPRYQHLQINKKTPNEVAILQHLPERLRAEVAVVQHLPAPEAGTDLPKTVEACWRSWCWKLQPQTYSGEYVCRRGHWPRDVHHPRGPAGRGWVTMVSPSMLCLVQGLTLGRTSIINIKGGHLSICSGNRPGRGRGQQNPG